ncbi:MAG: NAD(P)/FAD-dependent oxidoreductase [Bacilli bacterium]
MNHRLVLIGGGYAGMYFLRAVLADPPGHIEVTLVDRLPKSPLKTEFYSIAAGTSSLKEVTVPFPTHPQLTAVYDEVVAIDRSRNLVTLREQGELAYDTLVIALGCVDRFHGIPGAEENSLSLQSLKRAQITGHSILTLDAHRSVVLVGAGLTGVELAAELCETRHDLNITLVDRNDLVLNGFSDKLRRYVETWLRDHDIRIIHGLRSREIAKNHLLHENGALEFDQLVWTAGIQANPLVQSLGVKTDSIGRAVVDEWLRAPDDPAIFVLGDCAASSEPPTAQLAEFHGQYAAEVLLSKWRGEDPARRRFQHKGTLGSLGRGAGFGTVKGMDVAGKIPRILKSGVLWSYKKHVE